MNVSAARPRFQREATCKHDKEQSSVNLLTQCNANIINYARNET
jgi:hypothetical protein